MIKLMMSYNSDGCAPMFIAALFEVTTWDEWIKKMWCICITQYNSALKINGWRP
jgi:hypothetical protein